MKEVKIYTKSTCPFCIKIKQFFTDKSVPFENVDLTNNPDELAALKERTGMRTVPQVFIGGELVGGCDDVLQLDAEGKLDALLA